MWLLGLKGLTDNVALFIMQAQTCFATLNQLLTLSYVNTDF